MGVAAFGAGELIFRTTKKEDTNTIKTLEESLQDAKNKNVQISKIIPKIEDEELVNNIKEIHDTVDKIISAVEKTPKKYKKVENFFEYYLPVTINILNKYDEIENQRLTTQESKKFMTSTQNMVKKINQAFKNQLANLYQSDMIDTDAEMKVFETMLKSEGYDSEESEFNRGDKIE